MILLAMLLATAQLPDAVGAERRFAALAAEHGQWPAKRATAARDGVIFAPTLVNALDYLATHPDPGHRDSWRPARVFTSCDGSVSVTTGPWHRAEAGRDGLFTTIWQRQANGELKWRLDDGNSLDEPWATPGEVVVTPPLSCRDLPARAEPPLDAAPAPGLLVQATWTAPAHELPSPMPAEAGIIDRGGSDDHSLVWEVRAVTGEQVGEHVLRIYQWDGRAYRLALFGHWGDQSP